ncbi:MAG: glycosyltransferase [Bacteroidales bacterium]
MKFSLVVTCYNEMVTLHRWKENVMAQTRPPDEIVIVDSESNDGTTGSFVAINAANIIMQIPMSIATPNFA